MIPQLHPTKVTDYSITNWEKQYATIYLQTLLTFTFKTKSCLPLIFLLKTIVSKSSERQHFREKKSKVTGKIDLHFHKLKKKIQKCYTTCLISPTSSYSQTKSHFLTALHFMTDVCIICINSEEIVVLKTILLQQQPIYLDVYRFLFKN